MKWARQAVHLSLLINAVGGVAIDLCVDVAAGELLSLFERNLLLLVYSYRVSVS